VILVASLMGMEPRSPARTPAPSACKCSCKSAPGKARGCHSGSNPARTPSARIRNPRCTPYSNRSLLAPTADLALLLVPTQLRRQGRVARLDDVYRSCRALPGLLHAHAVARCRRSHALVVRSAPSAGPVVETRAAGRVLRARGLPFIALRRSRPDGRRAWRRVVHRCRRCAGRRRRGSRGPAAVVHTSGDQHQQDDRRGSRGSSRHARHDTREAARTRDRVPRSAGRGGLAHAGGVRHRPSRTAAQGSHTPSTDTTGLSESRAIRSSVSLVRTSAPASTASAATRASTVFLPLVRPSSAPASRAILSVWGKTSTAARTRWMGPSRGPPRNVSANTDVGIRTSTPSSSARTSMARARASPRAQPITAPESRIKQRGVSGFFGRATSSSRVGALPRVQDRTHALAQPAVV
jgi:hypothetical protein